MLAFLYKTHWVYQSSLAGIEMKESCQRFRITKEKFIQTLRSRVCMLCAIQNVSMSSVIVASTLSMELSRTGTERFIANI